MPSVSTARNPSDSQNGGAAADAFALHVIVEVCVAASSISRRARARAMP
jgi:hypothetical protein